MAKDRLTTDQAIAYLQQEGLSVPKTPEEARRKARGHQAGLRGAELSRHKKPARPWSVQFSGKYTRIPFKTEEWRIGRLPTESGPVPQPKDILKMVLEHTSTEFINVGMWGYLLQYTSFASDRDNQWAFPHVWVLRSWVIEQLSKMSDRKHEEDDPEYLIFAHNLVAGDRHDLKNISAFQQRGFQDWEWERITLWTVRDGN